MCKNHENWTPQTIAIASCTDDFLACAIYLQKCLVKKILVRYCVLIMSSVDLLIIGAALHPYSAKLFHEFFFSW